MRIGVGLPATIPGASGPLLIEWARAADAAQFSSLAVFDRLLYDNFEWSTALGAAAAVTSRIQLATSVVIAPLRSAAILAKQAASVNALSGGRLVLGLGLGARSDDYEAAKTDKRSRGRTFTDQLSEIRNWWEGGQMGPHLGVVNAPPVLVGGSGGLAMSRMARYADGYIHGGGPPRAFARAAGEAQAAWEDLGRPGSPMLWGMGYFALGASDEQGSAYLRDYYAFTGPFADRIASGLLKGPDEIAEFIQSYTEAGCTDLILFPTVAQIEQLHLLVEAI
jgi:alkanesulfonate monooxygenase SsuD/methylene tetrahydromethanopterin reductase-like flavin-dependent oxidoreductase (luciferase family)